MHTPISLAAALLLVPLFGCLGGNADSTGDSADTGDTDADTDRVIDTDVEPGFLGTVTLYTDSNGEPDCDVAADLTGIDYTGGCVNCDFKFTVTEEITRDDNPGGCRDYMAQFTYIGVGLDFDVLMAHSDKYLVGTGYYGSDPYAFYDVLLAGLTRPSYGPTWYVSTYYDADFGTFSREGDNIEWAFSGESVTEYKDSFGQYYEVCGYVNYVGTSFSGLEGTSTVDCVGTLIDVWEVTSAGGALDVSVDTVGADSTFNPRVWVNAPDSCTIAFADDDYTCTFPPAGGSCPTPRIAEADLTAGTHQVIVQSLGSCAGAEAAYVLRVDGAATLELAKDDVDTSLPFTLETTFQIHGSGTILP